jgi:hypothetical protein
LQQAFGLAKPIALQGDGLSFGTLLFQTKRPYNDNEVVKMGRLVPATRNGESLLEILE